MPVRRRSRFPYLISFALLAVTACSRDGADGSGGAEVALEELTREASTRAGPDDVPGSRRNAIVTAAERVSPAVVSINTVRRERVVPRSLLEQMMLPPGYEEESAGLGSGFIVHSSGVVVTNEHVVRGADDVGVTLPDGREFAAEVVGTDEMSDLAVLRLRPGTGGSEGLPAAPLGRSDDLLIGEWVVAIGNPLGMLMANTEPSVTAGVVSALGRNIIPSGDQRGFYLDMIQTDASINPGNSGGPLVNALGEVVGVNSSIFSQGGGSEGLGFAIPIERVRRVMRDLLEGGRVRHAWIGAEVRLVRDGASRRSTVQIASVVRGSPAHRAGLRPGMAVRSVGGRSVRTPLDWEAGVLRGSVGAPLAIRVTEGRAVREYRVVPSELPSMRAERVQALRDLQLVTLTPAIRAERGVVSDRGALIVSISDAASQVAGLQAGDVILQLNRVSIDSAETAARVLEQLAGAGVVVFFERGGQIGRTQFLIG